MGRGQQHRQPAEPTPPPDPLADLRSDPTPGSTPDQVDPAPEPDPAPEGVSIRPMVDQETHDEMVSEVVAAWHADPTSQGFLHGGGQCGCRYMARRAMETAVPVVTEEDLEERELETSGG